MLLRADYLNWADNAERKASSEVDFGANWRLRSTPWPVWRVSWIEATGELYAVELLPTSTDRRFVVLGEIHSRRAVETALTGWTEIEYLDDLCDQLIGARIPPTLAELFAHDQGLFGSDDGFDPGRWAMDDTGEPLASNAEALSRDIHGKVYVAQRPPDDEFGDCRVTVVHGRHTYSLPTVKADRRGDGWEWGYGGTGPAILALAILADLLGETGVSRDDFHTSRSYRHHQPFKWAHIASAPRAGFSIAGETILAWLAARDGAA